MCTWPFQPIVASRGLSKSKYLIHLQYSQMVTSARIGQDLMRRLSSLTRSRVTWSLAMHQLPCTPSRSRQPYRWPPTLSTLR
jgi:hypothetical protein